MCRMKDAAATPIEIEIDHAVFKTVADTGEAEPTWAGGALPEPLFDVQLCFRTAIGSL